jgi:hypothetical protein
LEKTVQSVDEQHPTEMAQNLEEQKNKLERLGVIALSIFGFGVIGFFLYMVVTKAMSLFGQGKILAAAGLIGLVVVLSCGLLSVLLFAKANELKGSSSQRKLKLPAQRSENASTTNLLSEGQVESIPSVTERTTELLGVEAKGKKTDKV